MTLQERAEWTKAKIEESCKQGEDTMTIRYWVGYLDGLIAALESAPVWTPCSEVMPKPEPYNHDHIVDANKKIIEQP